MLAGTVFSHLHQPGSWDDVWKQVTDVAALTQAVGGEHIVVIPDVWRDHKTGGARGAATLTDEQWGLLTSGHDELGRRILEEYGLHVQFHSHADSHVGYQPEIERFLEATNPDYVNLCLDTGHVAYYGGDCVDLITRYPERIGYVHLKQVDPAVVSRVLEEDLSFPGRGQDGRDDRAPAGSARHAAGAGGVWPGWTARSRASSSTTSTPARRTCRCPSPSGPRPTCPPAATSRSTWGPCGDAPPHHHPPVIPTE